ncbi:KpsF/GutQ family sugar-phosphate isomerase, partial [Glaesserella parasuis]|nr:KpsF/GutQ family sugar-phosphate isomerase [Glaesserella parasuis]MDG6268740.1 KpsF/GutQ family sugar-phosphate isomerase [Glaesserella parasuis]
STFLAHAEEYMKEKHIHSLIAVNEAGKVTGIVEFAS